MRGYFKIGIHQPKTADNVGTLIRSAYAFGASEVFIIGERQKIHYPSAVKLERHIPVVHYRNYTEFLCALPMHSKLSCIELHDDAQNLTTFEHRDQAVYLLGAEDEGLPYSVMDGDRVDHIIQIESLYCLNVATAGSIVMRDRYQKRLAGTK